MDNSAIHTPENGQKRCRIWHTCQIANTDKRTPYCLVSFLIRILRYLRFGRVRSNVPRLFAVHFDLSCSLDNLIRFHRTRLKQHYFSMNMTLLIMVVMLKTLVVVLVDNICYSFEPMFVKGRRCLDFLFSIGLPVKISSPSCSSTLNFS